MGNVFTEIHDNKSHRIRNRDKGPFSYCKKCDSWQGHEITCEDVTLESLASLLIQARKAEEISRERAANYFDQLQRLSGKLAILRHENNKLRERNTSLVGKLASLKPSDPGNA